MRDRQANTSTVTHSIPVISPVLHCVSMPVLVFWRYGFGYAYLSPKSIFLASTWAAFLFSFMVWKEPDWQQGYGYISGFASSAGILYMVHLGISVIREIGTKGEHDQFSGNSWLRLLLPKRSVSDQQPIHFFWEPVATFAIGLALKGGFGLSLCVMGISLFLKESINAWLTLRKRKRMKDGLEETQEEMTLLPEMEGDKQPITSTRKQRVTRKRIPTPDTTEGQDS